MNLVLKSTLLAALLCVLLPSPAGAQQRAYAPENLRTLSIADQSRVIGLEYSEQSNGRRIPDDQLRFYLDQINRSHWSFSRIKSDIAQSLSSGGTGPQPITGPNIRCESRDGRAQTCPTPWRGHSRLARQLSKTACVEGRTWQSRRGQVSVNGGCRAEFTAARTAPAPAPYSVTCSSASVLPTTCAWNSNRGRPYLVEQLSQARCVEGLTWGYRTSGLWVSSGCRARFGTQPR